MKVRVRAFAAYREILGKDELELELPDGTTARGAFETLLGSRPDFSRLLASTMFAVNREYVGGDHLLHAGDELVFLPPLAGGYA
jgi:molybdopterin converting factor subunit 1